MASPILHSPTFVRQRPLLLISIDHPLLDGEDDDNNHDDHDDKEDGKDEDHDDGDEHDNGGL